MRPSVTLRYKDTVVGLGFEKLPEINKWGFGYEMKGG